jgi:hypothetical protein
MAQQQVEEQRRQMMQMEADQDHITEQVHAEVHRAKVRRQSTQLDGFDYR